MWQLLFLAFALGQQPCSPTLVSLAVGPDSYRAVSLQALNTHAIVRASAVAQPSRLALFSVEYAKGTVTAIETSGNLSTQLSTSPDGTYAAYRFFTASGGLVFTSDALATSVVQLNPPDVIVDTNVIGTIPFVTFSPDSRHAVFVDGRKQAVSGVYASPARQAGAAVRLSPASQSGGTFSAVAVSADSLRLVYIYRDPTDSTGANRSLFVASLTGAAGSAVPLSSAALGVVQMIFLSAPSATLLAYTAGTPTQLFTVDVATDSNNVMLTAQQRPADAVVALLHASESVVIFRGLYGPQTFESFYAALPGVAASQYVISNNTQNNVLAASQLLNGTIHIGTYKKDASDEAAVWAKDATRASLDDLVRLSPDVTFPVTGQFNIGGFTGGDRSLVTFTGMFSTEGDIDSYYNSFRGPTSAAVRISPPGSFSVSNTPLFSGSILMMVNGTVPFVVTPGQSQQPVVSREQDRVLSLRVQPNSVSAIYTTQANEVLVTCLVPPTVVGSGQNVTVPLAVAGHLIVQSGGAVTLQGNTAVQGTLVAGGTVVVPCQAGTQVLATATLIVGSFEGVAVGGCAAGCVASGTASQSSSTLSVTVAVACPEVQQSGLSAGAIAGIVVGVGALGVLVAFAVAFARRLLLIKHRKDFEVEAKAEVREARRGTGTKVREL